MIESDMRWTIIAIVTGIAVGAIVTIAGAMMHMQDAMHSMDESLKRISHVMVSHE